MHWIQSSKQVEYMDISQIRVKIFSYPSDFMRHIMKTFTWENWGSLSISSTFVQQLPNKTEAITCEDKMHTSKSADDTDA